LENSSRGVWSLTPKGKEARHVDPREVVRFVAALNKKQQAERLPEALPALEQLDMDVASEGPEPPWQEQLLEAVLKMPPDAFERLSQRLLREAGFVQVEVTGRSGDGGIDGRGILRLGGVLSFHVNFQCKRWQNVVGPATVREFRGAMMGRADKGLIITTSTFTKEAQREATRDGAAAIDLVDGEQLVSMLKEFKLGVSTRQVEEVTVDPAWFTDI
jgi:restriction system protein